MSGSIVIESPDIEFTHSNISVDEELLERSHCHDTYEILFITSGEGRYLVEGTALDIRDGTLLIIRPLEYHSVEVDLSRPYERYVINFTPTALIEDTLSRFDSLMSDPEVSGRYFTAIHLNGSILSLFERFTTVDSLPDGERAVYMRMLLSEIILLLSVTGGEKLAHDEEELGARVIRYLNQNITKDLSLDKLAKRFFVSKYYLCRAFKKHNGISIHGYINKKRVMYAKQLIESGETASNAAYRVGFGDYSAFYRAYVKIIGKAPTAT